MRAFPDISLPRRKRASRSRFDVIRPCLLLTLFCTTAPARDWIVNPESGADTNAGTSAAPLATAQAAVDKAGPGDYVILEPAGATYLQSIDLSKVPTGLILDGNGVTLDGGGVREHGVVASGNNRNVKVFNLSAKHHRKSGFLITGESRGFQFFGISAFDNGKEGFVVRDRAECWIRGGNFKGAPGGYSFQSTDGAGTYQAEVRFEGEISLKGGRHSLTNCELVGNPDFRLLSIRGASADSEGNGGTASLVIQSLAFTDHSDARPFIEIGPGSFVYHDAASAVALNRFEISVSPGAELTESLYHTFPIGRDASGSPLMAWAGGATRFLPSNVYRIMHFGKFVPQDVAAKLSPDNDWLGLLAPLDTAAFPPAGAAFRPENSSAHAIWRWIGITAPDAVFVPDTREGRALGKALQDSPPAGIGMVNVFINRDAGENIQESLVLPNRENDEPLAKVEMQRRVARTPQEVLAQIAPHYGTSFEGSYIEALALIVKRDEGFSNRADELARLHLETDPALPGNGGDISGTLLYTGIAEPWAEERILAVAEMAFDEEGDPLEAMPTHSEMSDAVFMACPLLVEAGVVSGEKRFFDQCHRHFEFIAALCRRPDGLYRHSPMNEAAWGRGNGFPAFGLALVLPRFPREHEGHPTLLKAFQDHLTALAAHQNTYGMWHQIIDHPDSYAEFSATCMIAYAIAVGLENGWLEGGDWEARLDLAWSAVKMHISTDGTTFLNVCTGTGKQASLEDYYRREAILGRDSRGAAMALMLAAEMKKRYTQ
jgi:unsaturated rhamnogalacturonyl hydrolase